MLKPQLSVILLLCPQDQGCLSNRTAVGDIQRVPKQVYTYFKKGKTVLKMYYSIYTYKQKMNTSRVFTFFGTPGICISMWHWVGSLVVLRSLHSESSEQWSPCCFFLFQVHHTWSHRVGTILRIHILPRKAKSICWKLDFYFFYLFFFFW